MPYRSPFHTIKPGEPHVYHNNSGCRDGKDIEYPHWRGGEGTGRSLCKECERLNSEGK